MSRDGEDRLDDAPEHAPLINARDDDNGDRPGSPKATASKSDDVEERTIGWSGLFIWSLTFSAGLSGLLFGYDTGVISATLVSIGSDLSHRQLTTLDKSLVTSCTSFFALLASPTAGVLADALGRKRVILIADALFVIGATWQAYSTRVVDMIIGRSLVGVAIGAASFVAPMYISELAPSYLRGRMVTISCLLITGGQVLAYVLGWLLSTVPHGWRSLAGIGTLPAILQVIVLLFLPETPRWLIRAGRKEQGMRVLKRVYGAASGAGLVSRQKAMLAERVFSAVEAEVASEEQTEHLEEDDIQSVKAPTRAHVARISRTFKQLVSVGGNRRALAITCMLQGAQQLCGFNSLMYFSATIFALVGFRSPTLTALLIACTNFVFTLIAFYAIDRIGRRRILLISMPAMSIGLGVCALAFYSVNIKAESAKTGLERSGIAPLSPGFWPIIILTSMVFYVAAYATGLGNVPWQQSELFPLGVRSLGSSLATATNWGSNTLVGLTFLPMMNALSPTGTFALYAVVCAMFWILVRKIYPETAGLGLEEVGNLLKDGWGVEESLQTFKTRNPEGPPVESRIE